MQCNSLTLLVFHFDISGKANKELQPLNKWLISFTFEIFHSDISGKDINELHSSNLFILKKLEVSNFDKSGIEFKEIHPENK